MCAGAFERHVMVDDVDGSISGQSNVCLCKEGQDTTTRIERQDLCSTCFVLFSENTFQFFLPQQHVFDLSEFCP